MTRKMKDPQAALDAIAKQLRHIDPARLETLLVKKAVIQFRVTESEKADIQRTASELGLTVTDYLLRLHAWASESLTKWRASQR